MCGLRTNLEKDGVLGSQKTDRKILRKRKLKSDSDDIDEENIDGPKKKMVLSI